MLFKTLSAAVYGIDAELVEVEVDLTQRSGDSQSETYVTVVGLPDLAVRESRERIRAAITNCGFFFPVHKTTINLAPANVKKEGSAFDLPIAVGILGANGDLKRENLDDVLLIGELALDGRVRPVRGALPIAVAAKRRGLKCLLLPAENAREAAVVSGLDVYPVKDLIEVVTLLNSDPLPAPMRVDLEEMFGAADQYPVDFREVRGQMSAKRAIEIATAGGPQHPDDRPARFGQDDAGKTHPFDPADDHIRGGAGDDQDSQRGGLHRRARFAHHPPIPFATPHDQRRRVDRGRRDSQTGRSLSGASRRALPRRASRIRAERSGSDAPAARRSEGHDQPRGDVADLSRRASCSSRR